MDDDALLAAVARIPARDPERREWTPPTELDEYRLIRSLGRGGMGSVWLAEDRLLDRLVAVKFIAHAEPDQRTRERFAIEARAAARLQHTNVVTVHRYGEIAGRPYLISEYIRGESLDKLAKPIPWERGLELGIALARGLAAAHRHGIVHRDIKPANAILTADGEAKLVDFGLAKLDHADDSEPVHASAIPSTRDLTEHGKVAGTPRYLAPEVRRGEPASRRSDVYQIGCILYELVTGRAPILDVLARQRETASDSIDTEAGPDDLEVPALTGLAGGARYAAVVARCLRRDPQERYASGDELRDALEQLLATAQPGELFEGNPYRGLVTFEAEHRALFFGRAAEVRAVVERLRGEAFVLVTGDSGVGKSSLCRAGVLPRLAEEAEPWVIVRMVPGARPLATLASALASELAEVDEAALLATMREAPRTVPRELRRVLGRRGLVVFVDQLEELATMTDRDEADAFAVFLGELVSGTPRLRLLATVRSDFLTRVAELPALGPDVARAIYLLRALSPDGAREAVVGPANATGVRFESEELVETLVASVLGGGGAVELPLLEFTLAELWEARDRETMTITARSLDTIGGVRGALALHAEAVLERLLPHQRIAARRLLLRLVTADRTRARRTEAELGDFDRAALDALVRGRLVVARGAEVPTYELAHERMIDGWPTLARWIVEANEALAVHARLAGAVAEWIRVGRGREGLWSARSLSTLAHLAVEDLTADEREFVRTSRRAARRRRWLRGGAIAALPIAIATAYVGAKLVARRDVDQHVANYLSEAARPLAQARAMAAASERLRATAFARFDAGGTDAETLWGQGLEQTAESHKRYAHTTRMLEAALLLDTDRDDVRTTLAEVTHERLLLAERDHRTSERDELAIRLELYAPELAATLAAPARLTTAIEPATAAIDVLGPAGAKLEVRDTLAPGSYVVVARAEGRATVRVPIALRAGRETRVAFALPPATAVPPGFVYVPAGSFLYGSRDDGAVRAFFGTAPMHERTTRSYLISRTEVTYAQWIEFLGELDPAERKRRTPRVETTTTVDTAGALALVQLATGAYELRFSPAGIAYTARAGEPIEYRDRARRKRQDWLRFPVSGVSPEDALAYAAWLDRTGRVKHARLCSELEWERAARGADGRSHAHGRHLAPDDANFDETYGHRLGGFGPDEVGAHPESTSPFGLVDTSGNVWEIVTPAAGTGFATRGGGYHNDSTVLHLANGQPILDEFRHLHIGLRICADP